jgi:hypothetical protein
LCTIHKDDTYCCLYLHVKSMQLLEEEVEYKNKDQTNAYLCTTCS